ncbi:hypothetical protein N7539_002525 [Penicillium diatomitis]|uniref:Uncharacterized protein n=1 Tax=Penicillium diatomitis TaxID=2819901 RepID=A0A9W9XFT4_9EURO|nr:uncharacterized protein N7539_002525 [Penicillium diatomitis]KAJ5490958.1 hypothetical protein N7539_002525 [Penicillium diatomitis]
MYRSGSYNMMCPDEDDTLSQCGQSQMLWQEQKPPESWQQASQSQLCDVNQPPHEQQQVSQSQLCDVYQPPHEQQQVSQSQLCDVYQPLHGQQPEPLYGQQQLAQLASPLDCLNAHTSTPSGYGYAAPVFVNPHDLMHPHHASFDESQLSTPNCGLSASHDTTGLFLPGPASSSLSQQTTQERTPVL